MQGFAMIHTSSGRPDIPQAASLWVPSCRCTPGFYLGFIQYCALDPHLALSTLFPAGVQSLDIGLGVEASVHCEEFAGLHISSLHLLLCPAHYAGRVSDDWKGICVNGFDLVLYIYIYI